MAKLGQDLFELLNAGQRVGNQTPVIYGAAGISSRAFAPIEEQLGFRLPEDFVDLFANLQDPGGVLFPWSRFQKTEYDASIEWVWHGLEFDIEHGAWLDRWGPRPELLAEAVEVVKRDFGSWPRLLPIYGHRFLAAEPRRVGNPVFSIKQMDIICYGADLARYLMVEFLGEDHGANTYGQKIERVDVWSDFAEGRYQPYGGS